MATSRYGWYKNVTVRVRTTKVQLSAMPLPTGQCLSAIFVRPRPVASVPVGNLGGGLGPFSRKVLICATAGGFNGDSTRASSGRNGRCTIMFSASFLVQALFPFRAGSKGPRLVADQRTTRSGLDSFVACDFSVLLVQRLTPRR